MSDLVKLVVNNLPEINKHVLLELDFGVFVDLNATGVYDTHIADEVSSIFADNHELTFPELFVVGDLVVVGLTFSDLEDTLVTFKGELEVLELLSVDRFESHVELVLGGFVGDALELLALEARVDLKLAGVQFTHFHAAEVGVVLEGFEAGAFAGRGDRAVVEEDFSGGESVRVGLDLVSESIVSHGGSGIGDLLHPDGDLLSVVLKVNKEVLVNAGLVVGRGALSKEVGDLVHEGELSDGDEEIVS